MIFNDILFLTLFLPVVLLGFFVPAMRRFRVPWLIAASFVFYGYAGLEHAIVLGVGTIWIYALTVGRGIEDNLPRVLVAIAVPLAALIYYKYWTFLLQDVLSLEPSHGGLLARAVDATLPAGISFFTFQMLAFAIDRYRGRIPVVPSFGKFALYITMFPQLVAGPILRFHDVDRALSHLHNYRASVERWYVGIGYLVFGLAAKVLLADQLGRYVTLMSEAPQSLSSLEANYFVFAYSFQIYFDFYGYSLIAIGLGYVLGFNFPANFRQPYSSLNPRDFWRRWHITLSLWLRDYLYLPLGGNQSYIRNILIVFALCGLWHGAGLNFMVWGLYHAALVIGYKLVGRWWDAMPRSLQWALNFTLVSFGWVLFVFDFDGAWLLLQSVAGLGSGSSPLALGKAQWMTLVAAAVVCFGVPFEKLIHKPDWRPIWASSYSLGLAGLFVIAILFVERSTSFIYFRF